MNCLVCRGACCESFTILKADVNIKHGDENSWFLLHAVEEEEALTFECRCTKLTKEGLCGIYETRPIMCRTFVPGSRDCIDTVKRRRTPEQFLKISAS